MNDLEKILKREGVLQAFVEACRGEHNIIKGGTLPNTITLTNIFLWSVSKKGIDFWGDLHLKMGGKTYVMTKKRLQELGGLPHFTPPRYKELI